MAVAHPAYPPSGNSWDSTSDSFATGDSGANVLLPLSSSFMELSEWGACGSFPSLLIGDVEGKKDVIQSCLRNVSVRESETVVA